MASTIRFTEDMKRKITDIVRDALAERFDPQEYVFDPIIVERKTDYYGDDYIDVSAVFHGDIAHLDWDIKAERVLYIDRKLEDAGIYDTNFAGIRYIEKVEQDYVNMVGREHILEHGWPTEEEVREAVRAAKNSRATS